MFALAPRSGERVRVRADTALLAAALTPTLSRFAGEGEHSARTRDAGSRRRYRMLFVPGFGDLVVAAALPLQQAEAVAEGVGHQGHAAPDVILDRSFLAAAGVQHGADRAAEVGDGEVQVH